VTYKDDDEFLGRIVRVTGDETRVLFVNVETKSSQSSGCTHIHQTSRKSLNELRLPARKLMATVFWERKGVLLVEFLQHETIIT
jgi:hypothetical protein